MTLPLHFCLSYYLGSSESRTLHCIISRRRSWGWSRPKAPPPASPCPHAEVFPRPAWSRRSWGWSRPEAQSSASPCPHAAQPGAGAAGAGAALRRRPPASPCSHSEVSPRPAWSRRSWGWSRPEAPPPCLAVPALGSFPSPSLEPAQLGLEPPGGARACRRSPLEFRTLHCMVSTRRNWGWSRPEAPAPCLALPACRPAWSRRSWGWSRLEEPEPAGTPLWSLDRYTVW
jgi:hypothetical protein